MLFLKHNFEKVKLSVLNKKEIQIKKKKMYKQEECKFVYKLFSMERVVDGDTIDVVIDLGLGVLSKQRIRLLGMDTPELRTSDEKEKKYGIMSKYKMENWINVSDVSENIELRCLERDSREKFGRLLAEVWVKKENEWMNVNKWMCDNHYAVPYIGQNKTLIEEHHLENRRLLNTREYIDDE
jgi:micrococcal nuclease